MGCGSFFSLVPPVIGATFGGENTLGILPIVWTTWFCGFFFVSNDFSSLELELNLFSGYTDCVGTILSLRGWPECGTIQTRGLLRWRHVDDRNLVHYFHSFDTH